ncbi:hypothetical protein DEU38_103356 [Rhodococcus sp. AG1013]|nr:hypothetical protein DEU38_103356 [Rhodococcus sp. AG1013]
MITSHTSNTKKISAVDRRIRQNQSAAPRKVDQ